VTQYLGMPCPQCRRNLRVRSEYRGRRVCCTHCGHPFLLAPTDDLLAAPPPPPTTRPGLGSDELALVLEQLQEIRGQFAQLRGEVRDLHAQIDQARSDSAPEREDAAAFLGRLGAEIEALRERAGQADRLEEGLHAESRKAARLHEELRAARTEIERLQAEHDKHQGAPTPAVPGPAVAMNREIDLANASDNELLEFLRSDNDDGPRKAARNGHAADLFKAPIEEIDRSAFLLPTFGASLGHRFGEFELVEEISRDGMTAIYMARRDNDSELVNLRIEAQVVVESASAGESPSALKIPGYEILGKLCDGSMGVLYEAMQESVDRVVIVKVLRDSLAGKPEYVKRFEREARMAACLKHRNIVATFDAGQAGGHHYLVMEHLDGETVQSHLDKRRLFDERPALQIALALAEALKHIHERGVVHRDVKPANIVLTREGNVKLIDLGLARVVADEVWGATEAGMAIGTPEYLSPEQARGQVDVDVRGDIYGLGATLYHMVTGRVPHPGTTAREVLHKHVDVKTLLLPPESINGKLSTGFAAVIKKMLARNREDRYRHPDDLILDLKSVLQGNRPSIGQPVPPAGAVENRVG